MSDLVLVNANIGNIRSVSKALNYIGAKHLATSSITDIEKASKIILPGVGSFPAAMEQIRRNNLFDILKHKVIEQNVPIFGICVGMQIMFESGYESSINSEGCEGLGFLKGSVIEIPKTTKELRIPHVGWNEVNHNNLSLFNNIPDKSDFYFVHSYYANITDSDTKTATAFHGIEFPAAIEKENIFAAQFHPEKSQEYGLKLIENFVKC